MSRLLAEAQARLFALRQAHNASKSSIASQPQAARRDSLMTHDESLAHLCQTLPKHLGWDNEMMRHCVQPHVPQEESPTAPLTPTLVPTPANTPIPPVVSSGSPSIRVHSTVALAVLKQEVSAVARVWWLMRHLDERGCGWLMVDELRTHLTKQGSDWRICGWRQLRNLLRQGEGVFWQRGNGRLWIRSLTKVTASLGVSRLQGTPVDVPVSVFTERIGTVRAHLYATFHSSRESKPIARETLTEISGLNRRTQRLYEQRVSVMSKPNYAIGKTTTPERLENSYWERGHACFTLTDHQGWHGVKGEVYIVWQLPNSYQGPHKHARRGRQKCINRQLKDLFMQGITGNVEWAETTYFGNGRSASRVYNRQAHTQTIYWSGKSGYWYALPVEERA